MKIYGNDQLQGCFDRRSSVCRGSTRTFIVLHGSVRTFEMANLPRELGKRIPSKVQWDVWGVGRVMGLPVHDQVEGWCVLSRVNRTAAFPYPLLPKEKTELDRMVAQGVISKVERPTDCMVLRIGRSTKGKQDWCSLVCRSNAAHHGGQAWISSH